MKKGLSALSRAVIDDLKDRKQEELENEEVLLQHFGSWGYSQKGLGYSCCRRRPLNPGCGIGQAIFDDMRMLGRE